MQASWNLAQWLNYQQSLHPSSIELGLERVRTVAQALGVLPWNKKTVVVAGTNGKGSCVALLQGMLGRHARIGAYTSPHLWQYNERIVVAGQPVEDESLIAAFKAIDTVRGTTSLTYFEFATLAALYIFQKADVDIALLEVGLGGRLDAVNIIDADVALITSIGLDHTAWLGSDREAIGWEKAGVMRSGQPVICGDTQPPRSVVEYAADIGARLACIGSAFALTVQSGQWCWSDGDIIITAPINRAVHADNLAAVIAAVKALGYKPGEQDIYCAYRQQAALPGRRELIAGVVPIVHDVCHNLDAARVLVEDMQQWPVTGVTHAVLGMLADKPVVEVARCLSQVVDHWYPAALDGLTSRGMTGQTLAECLDHDGPVHAHPAAALRAARQAARPGDRIIVCGSFFTVAQARKP